MEGGVVIVADVSWMWLILRTKSGSLSSSRSTPFWSSDLLLPDVALPLRKMLKLSGTPEWYRLSFERGGWLMVEVEGKKTRHKQDIPYTLRWYPPSFNIERHG